MAFLIFRPVTAKSYIYRTFREISKIQMIWQTRGWNEIQNPHFVIRYRPQDRDIVPMVLDTAEKSFVPVSRHLDYRSPGRTLIVIYPSKESLGRSFGWEADESAMGVYWAGVIRVLSPSAWIEEQDIEEVRRTFESDGPMAHELSHLMVDYITAGNYTRWFTEGVAQYVEAGVTGYRMEPREVSHPDELYPLAVMDREFDNLADQNMAYYESFQAVNYLVNTYGEESLKEILAHLGRGYSMDKSFNTVLGISMDGFENDLKNWVVE
jgi:hypothetical protein